MPAETLEGGGGEKHSLWSCRERQEFETRTVALDTGKKRLPL